MDNEEIRKLLQELKKNSDESTAVRSKVVKIHFDTPAEAARRRKEKQRAEAEEARRRQEEEEQARAAEEARKLEAERMAREVVEEAKLQAKAGFSPDLEQDLLAHAHQDPEEEAGEDADDLDLNWDYERPRLSSDDPYEEEEPAGGGAEEDPDDMPDSDEFSGEEAPAGSNPLRAAFSAVTGGFAALTERLRERTPGEDAGEEADGEKYGEENADGDLTAEEARMEDAASLSPDDRMDEEENEAEDLSGEEPVEYGPDEEWKRRMEDPASYKPKKRRIPDRPSFHFFRKKKKDEELLTETGADRMTPQAQQDAAEDDFDAADAEDDLSVRSAAESDARKPYPGAHAYEETMPEEASFAEPYVDEAKPEDAELKEAEPEEQLPEKSIEVIDLDESVNNREAEVIPLDAGTTGPLPQLRAGRFLNGHQSGADKTDRTTEKKKRNGGFFRKEDKTGQKNRESADEMMIPRETESSPGETWIRIRSFLSAHRRQLLIGIAAAAILIAAAVAAALLIPRMQSRRKAVIRADEGLTVQILSQPDAFTPEGDISLRIKAPETIQSVTINGENVGVEQGRTVDLDYHAQTGRLEVMAVSTDKVRSADVTLAYVDSAPPTVTVAEKNGMIELTAEDAETGVKAIYVGKNDGLSDIPMYEEYTEPIPADPDEVISYYATDEAGNSSVPVVTAMVPAESISFSQSRYGIFPGSETTLEIVTQPENAFVNNLVFEVENEKVAKVSGRTLMGVSEGDTKITASADSLSPVTASVSVRTDRTVTISAIGDCTLGTDINLSQNTSFNAYQAMYGNSYFFENVRTILSQDDATFANFEGTLTTSDERKDKPFAFKGDPSYTGILTDGSVEVVTLANNHSKDYGDQSFTDTQDAMEEAGIGWCEGDDIAYMDLNGVKTAFIGIYALENGLESMDQVIRTVETAKENGAELIIMEFHWGVELVTALDEFETQLAHAAIDAGADLVLGTHAHMILPIEKYNGRYIVYGLSNFCFGGNPYPHSYDTMIWQQTFSFTPDGLESEDDIRIIPCRISSDTSINNYQPTPVTGDAAAAIMQTIDDLSAQFGQSYKAYMVDGTTITE